MANVFSSPSLSSHPGLDEWVSVKPDGRIAVKTGKVDIGQRISTAPVSYTHLTLPTKRIV